MFKAWIETTEKNDATFVVYTYCKIINTRVVLVVFFFQNRLGNDIKELASVFDLK